MALILCGCVSTSAPRSARNPPREAGEGLDGSSRAVGTMLESVIARARIPGIAAVVLRGDEIVAQGVAGVRKRGSPEAITLADQFELSSCTKAMTATLVAMLVGEGKLGWDTTLAEIFDNAGTRLDPAWKTVTVRQLLEQRAGITGSDVFTFFASVHSAPNDLPRQRREFALRLLSRRPDIPPGTKFVYSATNYILAGAVLEKITGRSWENLMRERLYVPLGLASGGFGPPGTPGTVDHPWGHGRRRLFSLPMPGWSDTPFDPGSSSADYPMAAAPAGMAHLSITDWAKFVALHLRGDPANPQRQVALLNPDAFARLHTPAAGEGDYAGGWFVGARKWAKGMRPEDTGRVIFHAGDNGRWSTVVWVAPEIDFAMLIACNRTDMAEPLDEVARELLRMTLNSPAVK